MTALRCEEPDRVPVAPGSMLGVATRAKHIGASVFDLVRSPKKFARACLRFQEMFPMDIVDAWCDYVQIHEGWGAKTKIVEGVEPSLVEGTEPVKKPEDWEKLWVLDPMKDGRMRHSIEAIELLSKKIGKEVAISMYIGGALNYGVQVRGMAGFLADMIMAPDLLKKGLKIITESSFEYAKACVEAGAHIINFSVNRSSRDLITPEQHEEFGIPFEREEIRKLKELGCKVIIHNCGNEPYLDRQLEAFKPDGVSWWDRGSNVSLKMAKEKWGNKFCLMGGLDQVGTLVRGTPEEVKQQAFDAISTAGPSGFILAAGCDLSPLTPPENIRAMVEAPQDYARLYSQRRW